MRPLLIAFEGGDRCGKSTQIEQLYFFLKNELNLNNVIRLKHPDRSTQTGKIIDAFLKREVELPTEAMTLLLSSNLWDTSDIIEYQLKEGSVVLIDRYIHTHLVYSQIRGTDLKKLMTISEGMIQPDVVFYLRPASVSQMSKRADYGQERYESVHIQKQVIAKFDELFKASNCKVFQINSSQSIEEVANEISAIVRNLFVDE